MDSQKSQDVSCLEDNESPLKQPEMATCPRVETKSVVEILLQRYGLLVTDIQELSGYEDKNFYIQVDSIHTNPHIQQLHKPGYVVKIHNSIDSMDPSFLDAQHSVLTHLLQHKVPTQTVVPNRNGAYYSLETFHVGKDRIDVSRTFAFELRTYIPGRMIGEVPYTANTLVQIGRLLGNMTRYFENYESTFYEDKDPKSRPWSLASVPTLTKITFCLDTKDRLIIEEVVKTYKQRVVTQFDNLRKAFIHNDLNGENILVSINESGGDYDICGILDVGEFEYSVSVFDLAINICYMMVDSKVVEQLDVPGYILAGYLGVQTLTQEEWSVLVPCIAARMAQSLTLGAYAHRLQPDNPFVLSSSKKTRYLLGKFWAESENDLLTRWRSIIANYIECMS